MQSTPQRDLQRTVDNLVQSRYSQLLEAFLLKKLAPSPVLKGTYAQNNGKLSTLPVGQSSQLFKRPCSPGFHTNYSQPSFCRHDS